MIAATRTVCIVFAIDSISAKVVGVYANQELARKRVEELRKLGLLKGCDIDYQNEALWEAVPE